jgi:hypothetical protein
MAWPRSSSRRCGPTRSPARSSSSGPSGQDGRHSAYELVLTTVEYPWHPLFGRRLRVREGARRGRFDIVLVEDRPGRLRELPRWMCDPSACARMDLGPPRVALEALVKLASVLREVSGRRRTGSSCGCPASQEIPGAPPSPTIAVPATPDLRAGPEPTAQGSTLGGAARGPRRAAAGGNGHDDGDPRQRGGRR